VGRANESREGPDTRVRRMRQATYGAIMPPTRRDNLGKGRPRKKIMKYIGASWGWSIEIRDSRDSGRRHARFPPLAAVDTHRNVGAERGEHRAEQAAQVTAAEHSATRRTDSAGERVECDAALLTTGLDGHGGVELLVSGSPGSFSRSSPDWHSVPTEGPKAGDSPQGDQPCAFDKARAPSRLCHVVRTPLANLTSGSPTASAASNAGVCRTADSGVGSVGSTTRGASARSSHSTSCHAPSLYPMPR